MTMHSFNLILDLCLLLMMIFRLLGQSILLFTATDIIKQCPCTSAPIIFFSSLLTNLSPNSGQVGVSTSHLLLMRLSPHTSPTLRLAGLEALYRTPIFSLPSQIHVFACCWHCSFCLRLALLFLHGFLGSDPGCFFFTDSWVPTLAVSSDHHSNFHH